jgi:hypothetical protein
MQSIADWAVAQGWSSAATDERRQAEMRIRYLTSKQGRFKNCYSERCDDVLWIVGEIDLENTNYTSNRRSPAVSYAVVFAEFPQEALPPLRLRGKANQSGGLLGIFQSADYSVIDDDPAFQRQFQVVADHKDLVRDCLDRTLRDWFTGFGAAFNLFVRPRHLLLIIEAASLDAADPQQFVDMARATAARLTQNRDRSPFRDEPGLSRHDRIQLVQQIGGLSGMLQRKLLEKFFDHEEVADFVARPVPRDIPDVIWRPLAGDQLIPPFCAGFGFVMLCTAGVLAWVLEEWPAQLLFPSAAGVVALIFFSAFVALKISAGRKRAILRNGRTVAAKVQRVDETALVNGNQRVYKATIQLQNSGQTVTQRIAGLPAGRMMDLAGSDRDALVLQDPQTPERILVLDAFVL